MHELNSTRLEWHGPGILILCIGAHTYTLLHMCFVQICMQQNKEWHPLLINVNESVITSRSNTPLQAEKAKQERREQRMAERTIDAQRASATVPRDTVQLYEQLRASGLEYGPAFRLLRNVHVPDTHTPATA